MKRNSIVISPTNCRDEFVAWLKCRGVEINRANSYDIQRAIDCMRALTFSNTNPDDRVEPVSFKAHTLESEAVYRFRRIADGKVFELRGCKAHAV